MLVVRLLMFLLAASACRVEARAPSQRPRGVVLVIGDGMGVGHVTLARLLRGDQLQLARFEHTGFVITHSTSSLVTDSAAAATAYATGVRTANGHVGFGPDRIAHPSVLELAAARGLATGVVTTAAFNDATPAAFMAHHHDRKAEEELTRQIERSPVDVLVSAGPAPSGSLTEVRSARVVVREGEHDSDSPDAALADLAGSVLDQLGRDPDGFFLLVEHEGIDTASHHGATALVEAGLRSLDDTVGRVLDYAERRGDILVVVAGDHETGGLRIEGEPGAPRVVWTTDGHTGEAVPIFAAGPGASAFTGVVDNAAIGRALIAALDH